MFKNIFFCIAKIILFFVTIVIVIAVDIKSLAIGSNDLKYILYMLPCFLFFVSLEKVYPKDLRIKEKFFVHIIIFYVSLCSFEFLTVRSDKQMTISKFNKYSASACFSTFRGIMTTDLMNQFVQNKMSTLSIRTQYRFAAHYDVCRVQRLTSILNDPKALNKYCPNLSKSGCLKATYDNAFIIRPFTVIGIDFLFDLFEDTLVRYKYEDNQGDKIKYNLFSNLDTVDEYNDLLAAYESKQSFAKIFNDFDQKNKAVDLVVKNEANFFQAFKKSICANLIQNIEGVRQRMLSPEHAPNLSAENTAVIKYRIARFEQSTVCKK